MQRFTGAHKETLHYGITIVITTDMQILTAKPSLAWLSNSLECHAAHVWATSSPCGVVVSNFAKGLSPGHITVTPRRWRTNIIAAMLDECELLRMSQNDN